MTIRKLKKFITSYIPKENEIIIIKTGLAPRDGMRLTKLLDGKIKTTDYRTRLKNTRIIAEAILSGKAEYKNSKEIILKEDNGNNNNRMV